MFASADRFVKYVYRRLAARSKGLRVSPRRLMDAGVTVTATRYLGTIHSLVMRTAAPRRLFRA